MQGAFLLLAAVLTALQGTPDFISILHSNHQLDLIDKQPILTRRDRICLELCCTMIDEQEMSPDQETCFSYDDCSYVCDQVCCASIDDKVTTVFNGGSIEDTKNCLTYTCKMTDDGTGARWQREEVKCHSCNSLFITLPDHCCPRCVGVNDPTGPGEWGEWSACSVTCGEGLESAVRDCYEGETEPATFCPVSTLRTRRCYTPCPIHCEWEWTEYSDCSTSCAGGIRTRHPIVTQHPNDGGRPCPPHVDMNITDTLLCSNDPCPEPCEWIWSNISECSVTCHRGTQYRYPILTREPANGGRPCPDYIKNNITVWYQCNTQPCPVSCWWKWGKFSDCSCEEGRSLGRVRYPIIIQQPQYGGESCPDYVQKNESEEMKCRTEACSGKSCETGQHVCGGVCIPDLDQDCVSDTEDNCPDDPNELQDDSDSDGVGNACDNCPDAPNTQQRDSDMDGVGNACDNCRNTFNPNQENRDFDLLGDACDKCLNKYTNSHRDQDRDGVGDVCDNCPFLFNPDQEDRDDDFVGYLCEADKDTDGTLNQFDNCPLLYNPSQRNVDGDGYGDACDNCQLIPNRQSRRDRYGFGLACSNEKPAEESQQSTEFEGQFVARQPASPMTSCSSKEEPVTQQMKQERIRL